MQPGLAEREAFRQQRRAQWVAAVVSFIAGLFVVLSIDWNFEPGRPFLNAITLAIGLALAAMAAVILVVATQPFRARQRRGKDTS